MLSLTVITATLGDPQGLLRTVRSLAPVHSSDRWRAGWQHVIVDSSPEATQPGIEQLPGGWPVLRVEQAPRGVYAALNVGIEHAAGEILWFLNAGDELTDLATLARALDALAADAELDLSVNAADLTSKGRYLYTRRPRRSLSRSLLGGNFICHQAVLYRRRVFERIGRFDERLELAADYDHHLRCLLAGMRVRIARESLARFDIGGRSSVGWRQAQHEFAQSSRRHRGDLPAAWHAANQTLLRLGYWRTSLTKRLQASRCGPSIEPLWLWWKRL